MEVYGTVPAPPVNHSKPQIVYTILCLLKTSMWLCVLQPCRESEVMEFRNKKCQDQAIQSFLSVPAPEYFSVVSMVKCMLNHWITLNLQLLNIYSVYICMYIYILNLKYSYSRPPKGSHFLRVTCGHTSAARGSQRWDNLGIGDFTKMTYRTYNFSELGSGLVMLIYIYIYIYVLTLKYVYLMVIWLRGF